MTAERASSAFPSLATVAGSPESERSADLHLLQEQIEHAAHLLPSQGPITVFVHHNTLHALEDLPFDEAVQLGARIFGCQPYLAEESYRGKLAEGRIRLEDLADVLLEDLGDAAEALLGRLGTRYHLRLTMLQYPLRLGPTSEVDWFVAETEALQRMLPETPAEYRRRFLNETRHWVLRDLRGRLAPGPLALAWQRPVAQLLERLNQEEMEEWQDAAWEAFGLQALWHVCRWGARFKEQEPAGELPGVRHRDWLLSATGVDSDALVNDLLIRFCAAFLDQGMAGWSLPGREAGFWATFSAVYGNLVGEPHRWLAPLRQELARWQQAGGSPLACIADSLQQLGVSPDKQEEYIRASLLALRGWAGMIRQMELRADRVRLPAPTGSLVEFLAVRLLLDRLALAQVAAEELGWRGPLAEMHQMLTARLARPEELAEQRAFEIFQLAQVNGWNPGELAAMTPAEWRRLLSELENFSALERRRIYQRAFERRFRVRTLDALTCNLERFPTRIENPRFQAILCIDEREESFRRHLEEICPQLETFGVAGFFGVAMYYKGVSDAHFVPLCPVVIRPQNWVEESPAYPARQAHEKRAKARKVLGAASHQVHVGSRSLTLGAVVSAAFGILASVPLVARVLFPRLAGAFRSRARRLVEPPPATHLQMEQSSEPPQPGDTSVAATTLAGGMRLGFTIDELAACGERLLRDIGLTTRFARLVVILGHGSNSLNNPHKSAYDCGACGGGAGGPNARVISRALNDPRIRLQLRERGIEIPSETFFVGGFHNTCNDSVDFSDLESLPPTHARDFDEFEQVLEAACDRNAHERARRFMSAPLNMSFAAARRHVENRAEDLAQTRPECGHATNAICVVGRRARTRGLFLDRRAFLVSYDPEQDDAAGAILARILAAVVPVCAGINLEYYFSYVDPLGWGCGTKLPHNITSLLGVMDGAASDLRTGLPWQMVEIHEPVRLLFVIESAPDTVRRIIQSNPALLKLCRNDWVQLAVLNPQTGETSLLHGEAFSLYTPENSELPRADNSAEWYRGWREHLEFAQIGR